MAAQHPMILQAIGADIALKCNRLGYTKSTLEDLRAKVMGRTPVPEAARRRTVEALHGIEADFALEIKSSGHRKPPDEIRGLFTSGITEAIVLKLLIHSGRQDAHITKDAYFYKAKVQMSPKNVDFVWARPQYKNGAIYECKNQPARLVRALMDKNTPGHEAEWKKSELWLMLTVRDLLIDCQWKVGLNVVTLRTRGPVQAGIAAIPFIKVPGELTIVCLEDLGHPL